VPRPFDSSSPFVLVVEGQDEEHVLRHLAELLGLERIAIDTKEGYRDVLDAMGPEVKNEDRRVVGFVLDADSPIEDRWNEVRQALSDVRDLPEQPDPQGTIVEARPRVGVWLMPDNGSDGELEDLVTTMVRPTDVIWPLAEEYLQGLPEAERQHVERKPKKAALHVWLANKRKPGRMGAAIGAGHLDAESELASCLSSWLLRLFRDQAAETADT